MPPTTPDIFDSPKVRQSAKRIKTILALSIATLLLTFALLYYIFIARPFLQIDALHAKYATITRPSTYAQVLQTMGPNPTLDESDTTGDFTAFWDDEYPSPYLEESKNITHILQYSVPTFFLGVTFEFTFDKDKNLIGKHRYD